MLVERDVAAETGVDDEKRNRRAVVVANELVRDVAPRRLRVPRPFFAGSQSSVHRMLAAQAPASVVHWNATADRSRSPSPPVHSLPPSDTSQPPCGRNRFTRTASSSARSVRMMPRGSPTLAGSRAIADMMISIPHPYTLAIGGGSDRSLRAGVCFGYRRALRRRRVIKRFRNEMATGPGGRQIQIEDPDGSPIELFEPA
jgi:hypothetical protein